MAKKEIMIYGEDKIPCFNITFSVGIGGQNEKGDVMLIQAMFNFIALGNFPRLGLKSKSDLPALTGSLHSDTIFAIITF